MLWDVASVRWLQQSVNSDNLCPKETSTEENIAFREGDGELMSVQTQLKVCTYSLHIVVIRKMSILIIFECKNHFHHLLKSGYCYH